MGRVSVSIDDELEEKLRRQADQEDINISDLVGRGVKYYLDQHSLEARMSEAERRLDEIEEEQSRGITDKVSAAFGRDRSPP